MESGQDGSTENAGDGGNLRGTAPSSPKVSDGVTSDKEIISTERVSNGIQGSHIQSGVSNPGKDGNNEPGTDGWGSLGSYRCEIESAEKGNANYILIR